VNRYVSTADEEEQSEEDEDAEEEEEEDDEADAKGKYSMMLLGGCAMHHQHSCIILPSFHLCNPDQVPTGQPLGGNIC
jgi:hypothetical protein